LPEAPLEALRAEGLSLPDFENMAVAGNPSIARAASLVQAARGNWVQVGLAPNPQAGYEGQQIGSRGRAEQDGVFVEQEFVRGGKLRLNREIAAQEIARACQDLAATQQRVLTDVRVSFYQVLIAQEQERLTTDLASIARESLSVSDNLFKQKEVGRVDVLQSRLEVQNAGVLAENARNRGVGAWRSLAAVVGDPELPPRHVIGDLSEIPHHEWQASLERLLTTSPEIAIAMINVERARWAAERARVERTPNVTVRGLVNWRDNGIGGDSDGAISVGMPIPVWNKNQGGVTQAGHQAAATERALYQLELSLQNRLSPVFERYSNARNQVTRYRDEILPTAKETLDLTRNLYQSGELGYLSLLTAQRTYFQTNLSYLDAVRELRTASAEIDGLLLSNSLEAGR
jgi:cobalt-zinc-cadmium efflux system outer membrane protein